MEELIKRFRTLLRDTGEQGDVLYNAGVIDCITIAQDTKKELNLSPGPPERQQSSQGS
jgi:hypothetical protein